MRRISSGENALLDERPTTEAVVINAIYDGLIKAVTVKLCTPRTTCPVAAKALSWGIAVLETCWIYA